MNEHNPKQQIVTTHKPLWPLLQCFVFAIYITTGSISDYIP